MCFDLRHPRFASFAEFLDYSEGATVAPTAIYIFLLSATESMAGSYVCASDFETLGRELGIFAYLVHIMRDLVRDLQMGETGLLCISLADLEAHGHSETELGALAIRGQTDARFCHLMKMLCRRAEERERNGERLLAQSLSAMPRDCAFILRLIVSLNSEMRQRLADALSTVAGASLATAAIVLLHPGSVVLCSLLSALCVLVLVRWHRPRELAGLLIGASIGNLTEVLCDLKGIWIHATSQLFGAVPLYILICYPILGIALPPLIDALLGYRRPCAEGELRVLPRALCFWLLHLGLSMLYGTENQRELIASALTLLLTLASFHSPHDLGFAGIGALLALVRELPCTLFGAWRFAAPQLGGVLPYWLPLAYAVFFINLGRMIAALGRLLHNAAEQRNVGVGRLGD